MLKRGDMVVCIKNDTVYHKGVYLPLTIGKIYRVLEGNHTHVFVYSDDGRECDFFISRFIKVDNQQEADMLALIYS